MHVVRAGQKPPETVTSSIFLAGPTPRGLERDSWRPEALALLEELGFDGVVFVPEPEDGGWTRDYIGQVDWEERGLNMADAIVFWVPRELDGMPAFTTNVEWGAWYGSGKVVLGSPPRAPKMRYLQTYAKKLQIPTADTLRATLEAAIDLVGPGTDRRGGERQVPLHVWRTPTFQRWYAAQRAAGHRLDGARVQWGLRTRHGGMFAFILKVSVHIPEESRNKSGEVILGRSDTSSVLAYRRGEALEDTRVVLVREFRSAASGPDGYVWELPGGSSPQDDVAPRTQAVGELEEETGVLLPADRLRAHVPRQTAATLLTHHAHLYSVELTDDELAAFEAEAGVVHGAHDSERTTVHVWRVGDLLASGEADWTTVGMVLSVLAVG